MEPEDKLSENENNKRKYSQSETDESDPKRILLESSVSSTTLSAEVSTSTTTPDILLPSSSGLLPSSSGDAAIAINVFEPSELNNLEELDDDPCIDLPTSSVILSSDYISNIESPSSSVLEDVNITEFGCTSTKEGSHIETSDIDIGLIEVPINVISSNIVEHSSEPDGNKPGGEKKVLNIENEVVSSSDQFADVDKKDGNNTSSALVESEDNFSHVEEMRTNKIEENDDFSQCTTDQVEDKLNISSTTDGDEGEEEKLVENPEPSPLMLAPSCEINSELPSQSSVQEGKHVENIIADSNIEHPKSPCTQVEEVSNVCTSVTEESKENLISEVEKVGNVCTSVTEKVIENPIIELEEVGNICTSVTKEVKENQTFDLERVGNLCPSVTEEVKENLIPDMKKVGNVCTLVSEEVKENLTYEVEKIENVCALVSEEVKENLTFEGTFRNVSHNIDDTEDIKEQECDISPMIPESQDEKVNSSFVPISSSDSPPAALSNVLESEQDKKSEISAMEIDSINHTPIEGSLVDTPCDSGETSPSTSTPADSCQVSAAPSPLLKEDTNLLYDESSLDTKEIDEDREAENIRPVRFGRRRKKRFVPKYKRGRGKSTPVLVDEETRMSATGTPDLGLDEDSQSSVGTTSKREPRRYRSEIIVPESTATFTADKVVEYLWPMEGENGEHFFIQEHISQFLGIISFKRRYPDLRRRAIESQEKEYLKDLGLVTEIACDLGLTAVRSEDMLDIMFTDFPIKYEELQRVLRERKEKQLKEEKGKVEYQIVGLDKSKMKEYSRKASLNASKWNAAFNRERVEERRYCFDLQTFSLHLPSNRAVKLSPSMTKMGSYPVAVLPGQYTDYCKRYSASELKGMPLQTVLAGPFTAEELAAEMQEDSDDDDGSANASVGTCSEIKEEPDVVPAVVDPMSAEKQPRCKVCNGGRARNKDGKPEPLIICGTCRTASHPTCIDLTLTMIDKIESYCWQCMDCKTCAQCNDPDDEERMIFCDMCDRGYHIYCVGLRRVPNGRWHCKECAICFTCGSRNPSGNEHIKNAEWQHEFKKDKTNKQMKYACTLCMPCDKYWKRRQFCSVCMKVYRSIPEDGMVRCLGCPKYVHKDGCSILHENERFCNYCFKSRNKTALNHSRIIAAAKKKMATGNPLWK